MQTSKDGSLIDEEQMRGHATIRDACRQVIEVMRACMLEAHVKCACTRVCEGVQYGARPSSAISGNSALKDLFVAWSLDVTGFTLH